MNRNVQSSFHTNDPRARGYAPQHWQAQPQLRRAQPQLRRAQPMLQPWAYATEERTCMRQVFEQRKREEQVQALRDFLLLAQEGPRGV